MKKKQISILQVSRLLIQIVFFILLPSLYINAFVGIKQIYIAIIRQNVSFTQLIPQLIEALAIIPFTMIMGRFFCGWMCAFGAFGDFIYKISSKIFKIKFRVNENVDRGLKYVKYAVLAFLIFGVCTFNITTFSSFSPWDVFGMLFSIGKAPAFSYVAANLTAGLIIFILIVVASMFIERFFCRYLCPLGAVFAVTSKLRITKIKKTRTKCGNCRICTNNCAMGIPLYKSDVVGSGECINCMKCVNACPRKNVTLTVSGDDVRPLIAGVAAASVMTGLYYAGNISVDAAGLNSSSVQVSSQSAQSNAEAIYKDGTYEGSGTGFRGGTTTVSVVVKNGKISNITTISDEDTGRFYNRAFDTIIQEITNNQSTNVDAVSGATFSSNGIMEAVANALSNAKISTNSSDSSSNSATSDNQNDESNQSQAESSKSSSSGATSSDNENYNNQQKSDNTLQSESSSFDDSKDSSAAESANNNQDITSDSNSKTASNTAASTNGKYKDGTYEGSGTGFRGGTTTVSVVVKNGKISSIDTVSSEDTGRFYNRAFNTVAQEVIDNQSSNVDAVSGATYSSNGITEAVQNALSKAQ